MVLGLSISKSLGVLKLGGDRDLGLVHVGNSILKLLNLSVEVLVLNLETLLGGLSLIKSSGHLITSGVGVDNGSLEKLALFVKLSLALDSIFKIKTSVTEVKLKSRLVLLGLDLAGIERVNLLTKIRHGVVVLHAESSKCSLLGNVKLLELSLESGKFSLSLLVEHGAALLSLSSVASLNIEFFIKFLNASHQFLSLLGILGSKSGLIINLGRKGRCLLLLAGNSTKKFSLDTFKIG